MKFTLNIRNVLAASVIAGTIALSFGFGGGSAYAEGTTTSDQTTESVQSTATAGDTQTTTQDTGTAATDTSADTQTSTDTTQTQDTASTDSSAGTTAQPTETTTSESTPSLLPGDFFYFFKTIAENIKLALTFNDTDKALQIAQYAQERLAEANALIQEGKTDLAQETLEKAIEQQKQAEDAAEEATKTETADKTAEESQTSENQSADKTDLKSQIQAQFGQNILALQTALDKVDNPKAKEAIMKNMEKAQKHVSEKIAKRLEKLQKEQSTSEDQTAAGAGEDQQATTSDGNAGNTTDGLENQTTVTKAEANVVSAPTQPMASGQTKQPAAISGASHEQKEKNAAPTQPAAPAQVQPKTVESSVVRGSVSQQPAAVENQHKGQQADVKKQESQKEDHGKGSQNKKEDNQD